VAKAILLLALAEEAVEIHSFVGIPLVRLASAGLLQVERKLTQACNPFAGWLNSSRTSISPDRDTMKMGT
jgi:hypothetical protein